MKKTTKIFIQVFLSISVILFIATGCKKTDDKPKPTPVPDTSIPFVYTGDVMILTQNSAQCDGRVVDINGAEPTAWGICWSTSHLPDITGHHTIQGSNLSNFIGTLTDLSIGVTYYVRAYATNAKGTGYGDEKSFTIPFALGQFFKGGYIAYFFQPGEFGYIPGETHGIIAAPYNQSSSASWGCSGSFITGADDLTLGGGRQNTIDIISGCSTSGIAARLCDDLDVNGYSDWYLPSRDELTKLYENKASIGVFSANLYLSSSERSDYTVYARDFSNGREENLMGKSSSCCVRAIRNF